MKKINFISFTDKKQIHNYLTLATSIMKHYNEGEVELFVGVDDFVFKKYEVFFKDNNINVRNINDKLDERWKNFKLKNSSWENITSFAMGRLIMFDIFGDLFIDGNYVYLDSDTILTNRLCDEYLLSNKNYVFKVPFCKMGIQQEAIDFFANNDYQEYNDKRAKSINDCRYFNSGVIIINDRNRVQELFERCLNSSFADDETLLNTLNNGELVIIDDNRMNFLIDIEKSVIEDWRIIHFAGPIKPNNIDLEKNDERLVRYKKTGFYELYDETMRKINEK